MKHSLLPAANEVWGKVISLQVCVCPQGEYLTRYTPWHHVHPLDQVHTPPRTRYTPKEQTSPRDQVHPLEQTPPRPGTPPRDQVTPPHNQVQPPGADTLQDQVQPTPWDQVHPPGRRYTPSGPGTPPQCRACWEIRSTHRQYASYWNAILFWDK